MKQKKTSPLERLIADRKRLHRQCREQEQRLCDTFLYMQERPGRMLLSGLSMLLFPEAVTPKRKTPADTQGLLAVFAPVVWDIAKPVLLSWGIGKLQSFFVAWLTKGRKKK